MESPKGVLIYLDKEQNIVPLGSVPSEEEDPSFPRTVTDVLMLRVKRHLEQRLRKLRVFNEGTEKEEFCFMGKGSFINDIIPERKGGVQK